MRITKVEAFPFSLKYKPGFELMVHYGVIDSMQNYVVKLHTDDGLVGYGEAAPLPINNPTAFEDAVSAFGELSKVVIGEDPFNIRGIHQKMDPIEADGAVKGGIDFALYDLMGKAANQPVYKLLGGTYSGPLPMHYTLSIRTPDEMAQEALERANQGYQTLEVKVGRYEGELSLKDEVARVKAIREAVGDEVVLVIDPNVGWTPDEAIAVLREIEQYNVMVEQPVRGKKFLAEVRKSVATPVVADESCPNLEHLVQLIRMDACDMINLKILRVGGLFKAMQMMEICEAFGMGYRHDNVFQTRLASTACLHFAIAYFRGLPDAGGTQFTRTTQDLVGEDGLVMHGGAAALKDPEAPGIGATPKEELLGEPHVFT